MANKTLTYRIGADIGDLRRKMEEAGTSTAAARREMAAMERQQRSHRQAIGELGQGLLTFGAAVAIGLGVAGKAAMDWETAFTGVRKTVDGSDQEIAALEAELRKLARTLPATHEEIAGVAEAAGQLGIKRKDIAEFTKVMVDLGNTTNLTAEEAATDLAKFSNIMGTSASDVDRLGSALVALGNDGASTEKDILSMALRIAGAGHQIGLSESQVLAFASALSSVGIEAEAGGSSMSTVMIKIAAAVAKGGDAVKEFSDVAGMSADEFAQKFQTDASGAIISFIQGLGKMQKAGGDVFGVLSDLGLSEIRVRDAMLRAGSASDMFTKSLQVGSSAWAENTALTAEADKRYQTSASKLQVAGNQIKDTLIDVGAKVAPIFAGIAQGGADVARGFQELPGPLKDVVTWVGTAAGGLGLFGGAAAIVAPKIMDFRDKMRDLEATGGAVGKGLGKVGLFMSGPWGAALGIGVGLLGLFAGMSGNAARKQDELNAAGKRVNDVIREQGGVINQTVRQAAAKELQDKGLLAKSKELGIASGLLTDAYLDQGNARDDLRTKVQGLIDAGTQEINTGESLVTTMTDQAIIAQELRDGFNDLAGGKQSDVQASKDVEEASKGAAGAQKEHAKSADELKKEAEDAAKAMDELVKALNGMNNTTLSSREAQRAYIQQLEDTKKVLEDKNKTLDISTAKGRENQAALDAQAAAANTLAEAVARDAEANGGAAAGAAALTASLQASRPQLIETAKAFGMGQTQAEEYADAVLAIPGTAATDILTPGAAQAQAQLEMVRNKVLAVPPNKEVNVGVLDQNAIRALEGLGLKVRTLPDGTVGVIAETEDAKRKLDNFANQQRTVTISIKYLGLNAATLRREAEPQAYGGVIHSYAAGGFENHRPQIAPGRPGVVRIWAEDETGGESYIPWAMDRRKAATGVLAETADGFGYDLVPKASWSMVQPSGGFGPAKAGGSVTKIYQLAVYNANNTEVSLQAQFERMELLSGG